MTLCRKQSVSTCVVALLLVVFATASHAADLSVLFLGGANGSHRPRDRFEQIQPVLAKQGIELEYTDDMDTITLDNLRRYHALLLFANIDRIDPANAEAILAYVNGGGGFVREAKGLASDPVRRASAADQVGRDHAEAVAERLPQAIPCASGGARAMQRDNARLACRVKCENAHDGIPLKRAMRRDSSTWRSTTRRATAGMSERETLPIILKTSCMAGDFPMIGSWPGGSGAGASPVAAAAERISSRTFSAPSTTGRRS